MRVNRTLSDYCFIKDHFVGSRTGSPQSSRQILASSILFIYAIFRYFADVLYNFDMKKLLTPEEAEKMKEKMRILAAKGGRNRKGTKNKTTLDREAALKAWQDGVVKRSQGLLNVQSMLALGSIKVFRIDSHWEDSQNGKTKYKVKSKPRLVVNNDEIIAALDFEFGSGLENPSNDSTYYFVTTKDPDGQAINSLMDRTFGRPKESIEITAPPIIDPKEREQANKALASFLHGRNKTNPGQE